MKKIVAHKYTYVSQREMELKCNKNNTYGIDFIAEHEGFEIYAPPSPCGAGWLIVLVKYAEEE